jgi:transcriptional regulator with XRE-family HTH domain
MQLSSYLAKRSISKTAFAQELRVSRQTLYCYLRGERMPRRDTLHRIYEVTSGSVTANDFVPVTARDVAV